jgi:hypothetical protein
MVLSLSSSLARAFAVGMSKETCSVAGCSNIAERSLSISRIPPSMQVISGIKKARLCKQHYKEFKKLTKEQRKLDMTRYRY